MLGKISALYCESLATLVRSDFDQEVIGDASRFRLMLCRHEQIGIGRLASRAAAEIQRGGRRGIDDSDLLDGVVHRDQSRGVGDGVLRSAAEIAGQSRLRRC